MRLLSLRMKEMQKTQLQNSIKETFSVRNWLSNGVKKVVDLILLIVQEEVVEEGTIFILQ